jgi:hypothetical protein
MKLSKVGKIGGEVSGIQKTILRVAQYSLYSTNRRRKVAARHSSVKLIY